MAKPGRIGSSKRGFTLIEMMVVTSIIGLLSSMVLAGINSAKLKSYDGRFMMDMSALRTALMMFRDTTGSYPTCPIEGACMDIAGDITFDTAMSILVTGKYISKVPHYQNWPSVVPNRNVYLIYVPSLPPAPPGRTYTAEYTCRAVNYASWKPGMYPTGAILINSEGPLNYPKVYSLCTDNPATTGCYTYTNYYCMELM